MLVAALAVFAYGEPRTTRDLDLVVDATGTTQNELKKILESTNLPTAGPQRNEFGVNFRVSHGMVPVEVFLSGTHEYNLQEFSRARLVQIGGSKHPVICPEDLLLRKPVSQRRIRRDPKDRMDALSVVVKMWDELDFERLRQESRFHRVEGILDQITAEAKDILGS